MPFTSAGAHKFWRFRGTSCQPGSTGGSEGMLVELEMWGYGETLGLYIVDEDGYEVAVSQ